MDLANCRLFMITSLGTVYAQQSDTMVLDGRDLTSSMRPIHVDA
jgi:hypothetical protein